MFLAPTLSLYLGKQFFLRFFGVLGFVLAIVLLVDTVELLRRAASKPEATFGLVMQMAMLKLLQMVQLVLPFVILFAGMLTFWRLTRTHELTVARAAGVSVWQFVLPAFAIALALGGAKLALVSPLAAATYARYESLETKYLRGGPRSLSVSTSGIWLRQIDRVGQSVIRAARISSDQTEMQDVTIFLFAQDGRFTHRVDAQLARLEPGHLRLARARVAVPDRPIESHPEFLLETDLTPQKIQDSFASPETISFWELPGFIDVLETAGFSALRHRLYFHSQLASPALFAAMVLIAAAFSMRPARRGGVALMLAGGAATGFLVYFMTDLVLALGLSASIPVTLAAWTPAAVGLLGGLTVLVHIEEG